MSGRNPNQPPAPAFGEFDDLTSELFSQTSTRYIEALMERDLNPGFIYLKSETSGELNSPVGIFKLVSNLEGYSVNQGEILEVQTRLLAVGDFDSGVGILEPDEPDEPQNTKRRVAYRQIMTGGKHSKKLMISEEGVTALNGYFRHDIRSRRRAEEIRRITEKLKDFKLVSIMPPDTFYTSSSPEELDRGTES